MSQYRCEFFSIEELVDGAVYDRFGNAAWMFFNPAALKSIDGIRKHFGKPVTINNWKRGGAFSQRGLRSNTAVGAQFSQHKFGNAFDLDVLGMSAEEVRTEILANPDHEDFKLINCVEAGVNWVHLDCRNIDNRILIVRP